MRTKVAEYNNGNVHVTRFSDGTVIRYSEDDEFDFAFPENLDVKICNRCDQGCPWCHEGSTVDGELGNIMNASWVDTLRPGTEICLGGGNILEHPDLVPFLKKLKNIGVFANITLNQDHFMKNLLFLEVLSNEKWIRGIGISLVHPTEEFFDVVKRFPNAVIHVIAGVLDENTLQILMNHGKDIKLLILGYKKLRRGENFYNKQKIVDQRIGMIEQMLPQMFQNIKLVSFDCLAIEQLHIKDHVPPQVWDQFYQGDDGTMTFYIDMVKKQFAISSTAPLDERWDIDGQTVISMFNTIKGIYNI